MANGLTQGQDLNSIISNLTHLLGQGATGLRQAEDARIAAAKDRRAKLDASVSERVGATGDKLEAAIDSILDPLRSALVGQIKLQGTPSLQSSESKILDPGTDDNAIKRFFDSIQAAFAGSDSASSPLEEPVADVAPVVEESVLPVESELPRQIRAPDSGPVFLGDAIPGRGELGLTDVPGPGRTARDAAQSEIDRLLQSLSGVDDERTPPTFFEKLQPILGGIAQGVARANTVGSGGVARVLASAGAGAAGAA